MDDKFRITPAGISALAQGDIKNFLVASIPGGIEKQEAEGQEQFVATDSLPKKLLDCTRKELEQMGILFGEDIDDLFVSCKFPSGWRKESMEHSMWSKLLDDKGRKRALIFYKAAFYDRCAHIILNRRFSAVCEPEDRYGSNISYDERRNGIWFGVVTDCEKIIFKTEDVEAIDYDQQEELRRAASNWLDREYPNWKDPLAYWE